MSSSPKRRLGSGVDALLSGNLKSGAESDGPGLQEIPLSELRASPYQPRSRFDDHTIKTLAASLKKRGALQPILVRPVGGRYELVAGERRFRAALAAGLRSLPAVVRDLSDDEAATATLIENIQREDLNPIEEAQALRALADRLSQTHGQIAERVGRARATVTNLIRLLELCPEVQEWVRDGKISMGHARVLVPLPVARQKELARAIQEEGLSVRQTERRARAPEKPPRPPEPDPDLTRLQQRLSDHMGCPVTLRPGKKGGDLVLRYSSEDSLQGLLERLGYSED